MTDVEAVLTTILCLTALYVLWLHFRIRRLNDKLQDATMAATKLALSDRQSNPEQEKETERLRQRVQVLERIATDREHTLAREIEEVRDR